MVLIVCVIFGLNIYLLICLFVCLSVCTFICSFIICPIAIAYGADLARIYGRIAKISACYRKSGSGNTTVTSDFRQEVEIRPFCACAMKNMQFGPYLWPNRQNSCTAQL